MSQFITSALAALSFICVVCPTAHGQQFRVYTEVKVPKQDAGPQDSTGEVVAKSVTIFHAGRTFDWLQTAGEVTIFERAHKRFVIFNGKKMIATTVDFDEIDRLLESARDETRNHANRLSSRPDRESQAIATALKFQLAPEFAHRFQRPNLMLKLDSPKLAYNVKCGDATIPEAINTYLEYADWTARLNHVMHPRSLYPAARLELNDRFREHKVLPVEVQLRVAFDQPLVLQAEHQFAWELRSYDRGQIQYWDDKLHDSSLEWLSFRDYQRAILKTSAQAGR